MDRTDSGNYLLCDMDQVNTSTNALVNGVSVSNGLQYTQTPTTLKQASPPVYDNNNRQEQVNANMPHASAFGMIDSTSEVLLVNLSNIDQHSCL